MANPQEITVAKRTSRTTERSAVSSPQKSSPQRLVSTAAELLAACSQTGTRHLVVRGNISNAPSIRLAPGQTLAGEGDDASISFVPGADGLQLSSDNEVFSLRLEASVDKRAIFNSPATTTSGPAPVSGLSRL